MKSLHSLNRLVDLREREVDRLKAEVGAKEATRQRYRGNLDRLEALCTGSGASGTMPPTLALNCAGYKQSVLELAASHRQNLSLHEADMAVTQRALMAASQRHEVLGQVLARHQERGRQAEQVREQKRQDELAAQVWARGRK
jgi:flagellar export protein FliJ